VTFVIDASVALKWVIPEADSDRAAALLNTELIAPGFWLAEVANALWRHIRLRQMTPDQALRRLGELASAPVASLSVEPHIAVALTLAIELRHPVYDCLYLALALHADTHVVTADRRFAAATADAHPGRVRLLAPD
jgi:predicted nucleic acid-binding protein